MVDLTDPTKKEYRDMVLQVTCALLQSPHVATIEARAIVTDAKFIVNELIRSTKSNTLQTK